MPKLAQVRRTLTSEDTFLIRIIVPYYFFIGNQGASIDVNADPTVLSVPAQLRRAGIEMRMVVSGDQGNRVPDASLVKLLIRASKLRDRLRREHSITLKDIAQEEGVVPSYATRLVRLTFLAPDIVNAIITGDQPPELTARQLMDNTRLPLAWAEQRSVLGFS